MNFDIDVNKILSDSSREFIMEFNLLQKKQITRFNADEVYNDVTSKIETISGFISERMNEYKNLVEFAEELKAEINKINYPKNDMRADLIENLETTISVLTNILAWFTISFDYLKFISDKAINIISEVKGIELEVEKGKIEKDQIAAVGEFMKQQSIEYIKNSEKQMQEIKKVFSEQIEILRKELSAERKRNEKLNSMLLKLKDKLDKDDSEEYDDEIYDDEEFYVPEKEEEPETEEKQQDEEEVKEDSDKEEESQKKQEEQEQKEEKKIYDEFGNPILNL